MEKTNKKKFIGIGIFILIVGLICCSYVGMTFINHEKNQNQKISDLEGEIQVLSEELDLYTSASSINWSDNGFNYLAIGNSITIHGICDYWWNEVGMAASDDEHDYYHLVVDSLEKKYNNVKSYAYNFATWEIQSTDRDESFMLIDAYLNKKIDLVTIQLGENAYDLTTFETDYESLIKYIKEKAPNAQIIVVGDFWGEENRDTMKINAANACNVIYVSLEEIKDNVDYQCGLGTIVYDENGVEHIVEHSGVASHPSDKGMEYIAKKIIEAFGS